jgi:3-oxoacyl-[acyl-carrier protein] reductase
MAYHAPVFDGRAVLVTNATTVLGGAIVDALTDAGARVAAVDGGFSDRRSAETAFATVTDVDAVVHVCVDERALVAQPLTETEPTDWELRSEALIREAICTFQAAFSAFTGGPGRIVLVAPTVGFTGAAGLVPYTTAVEGVRAMAKSAARQWGPQGITVNTVMVPPDLVAPVLVANTTFNAPPVIGRLPDVRTDVVDAIGLFTRASGGGITGSTVIVDGGSVMGP